MICKQWRLTINKYLQFSRPREILLTPAFVSRAFNVINFNNLWYECFSLHWTWWQAVHIYRRDWKWLERWPTWLITHMNLGIISKWCIPEDSLSWCFKLERWRRCSGRQKMWLLSFLIKLTRIDMAFKQLNLPI